MSALESIDWKSMSTREKKDKIAELYRKLVYGKHETAFDNYESIKDWVIREIQKLDIYHLTEKRIIENYIKWVYYGYDNSIIDKLQ